MNIKKKALIIGAGITGLARAYALKQSGFEVTIVDPSIAGGVMQTTVRDGFTLEQGPNVFLGKPEILSLVKQLGLENLIRKPATPDYQQFVWVGDKKKRVPRKPIQFLRSDLFTTSEKIQIIKNTFSKTTLFSPADDESVETFFSRWVGLKCVQTVIDPALKGIYGGDLSKLSIRSLMPFLWEAGKRGESPWTAIKNRKKQNMQSGPGKMGIFNLAGGNHQLAMKIAERIPVKQDSVTRLSLNDEQFLVHFNTGSPEYFDSVVIATSGARTASFLPSKLQSLAEKLRKVEYAPLIVAHIAVPASELAAKDSFGILFPTGSSLLGVMFNSEIFPHAAPAGQHLLTVCLGGAGNESCLELDDQQLADFALDEVKKRLGVISPRLLLLTRWKNAIPQLHVGHFAIVDEMREIERHYPGLEFIGVDNGGIGVADRVATAFATH